MTIDHDTFHAMEIDGLFEELDGSGASALNAHAASCETCGSRFERLRRARQRGLAALNEHVSEDFESRVMAAVDAALAARPSNVVSLYSASASRAPSLPNAAGPMPPAKVVPIFARPWFAAAASLFLVIGAAAILSQKAMSKKDATFSMSESAPAATMPAGQAAAPAEFAATATAAPATPPAVVALDSPTLAASAVPPVNLTGKADDGALAFNSAPPKSAPRAMKPSVNSDPSPPPVAAAHAAPARAGGGASSTGNDITFAAAKQLYTAGRYREAQAKFEALQSGNPEAALYAARCVQHTSGCGVAVSRLESLVTLYAGTSVGDRATVDLNNCNAALGRSGPAATTAPNSKASPRAPADVAPAPTPASTDDALK